MPLLGGGEKSEGAHPPSGGVGVVGSVDCFGGTGGGGDKGLIWRPQGHFLSAPWLHFPTELPTMLFRPTLASWTLL